MDWWIYQVLVFVFGLCLGSFLNVVIYRLPRKDLSIHQPRRSLCPSCETPIAWYDNLPLISYGLLLGKCRHCRTPVSLRYPLVELIAGLLTLAVFYKSGVSVRFPAELYFVLALVGVTFIDLDVMIIPDAITFPGMAIGVLAAALAPDPGLIGPWLGGVVMNWGVDSFRILSVIGSVLGLVLGWGLIWSIIVGYSLLTGKEGMGGGDLTLLAMIGAFLGWRSIFLTIFFGSIFALAVYFVMAARAKEFDAKAMLPFGPFLSLAALVYLFFGEEIIHWYLA